MSEDRKQIFDPFVVLCLKSGGGNQERENHISFQYF